MIITSFEQLLPFRNKSGIYLFTDKLDETKHYAGKAWNRLYKRIVYEHKNATNYKAHWIDRIIKQYGLLERFTIEIIHWWDNPVNNLEVLALETAVIDEYNCLKEKGGYNICLFSSDPSGVKRSKESCEKMRKANLGKKISEETRKKISNSTKGQNNSFYGKKHSIESLNKIKTSRFKQQKNGKLFYDKNIYVFKNLLTNEIFQGYRKDFIKKFNLRVSDVYELINKNVKHRKNWILIKNDV